MAVLKTVKAVQSNKEKLELFFSGKESISLEEARIAYNYLEILDPNLKLFEANDVAGSFPVQRIARLCELITIDIVKEYGIVMSRIGHPFDFSGDIRIEP